ncbi:Protein BUD31 like 2 [Dendrobium catenatum]|uniref:Protein BUD31 like 2 n=1 Tax=Dendrobium catenatum TaxID=906689 RepID=A0A2I0X9K0_9ASPA|nr:Protein BUD31 like 2 [Dendrobium catenatum]
MPKVKTSRIKYPEGWELIEPTFRELEGKMREAENDPHDGKRKCEALWPIFKIAHQKSRYVYDLYYRRKEISKDLYEFCLDQGYADSNLIAKWKKMPHFLASKKHDNGALVALTSYHWKRFLLLAVLLSFYSPALRILPLACWLAFTPAIQVPLQPQEPYKFPS